MAATILVVEDDATVAETIREVLVDAGYEVPEIATSAQSALDAAKRDHHALVLMDVHLEGALDGIDTARQLRERNGLRVIYITGSADDETLRRAKQTAPLGYLKKPFNSRELRIAVELALHQAALEDALAAREQWFATTLQSIGDAVLTTDPETRITFFNRAAEATIGVRAADALGKKVGEVVRLVDAHGTPLPTLERLTTSPGKLFVLPREARVVTSRTDADHAATVEIEGSIAPVMLESANAFGSVMVFRDVGERRQLERRLGMNERLAAIGTMAAGMQHEINNPLAAIVANLHFSQEVLRRSPSGAPSRAEIVEVMTALEEASEAADRVKRTVEELRHFSRRADGVDARVDVAAVLEESLRMTAHAIRHHATVRREYGTAPGVRAEEGQLARVFMNLLLNAAQSTGDGDASRHTIVLTTRTDAAGRAVAEVKDNGVGFSPDKLHRIFDPFFMRQPENAALGLGLAISHSIVTSLGGEIDVQSELGKGTTFRVSLPPAESTEPAPPRSSSLSRPPPSPRMAPTPARGRVLVVDDEVAIGKALRRVLSADHDVTLEQDARVALERLANEHFDVVFCDLMMPNMSGMDFFDELSARAPDQAAKVVFLTGGAFSPRSEEFLRDNRNICLPKPFTRDAVRSAVNILMDPAGTAASTP